MKRLIKYHQTFEDKLQFSTCGTNYEALPVLVPDNAGRPELRKLAKSMGLNPVGNVRTLPETKGYRRYSIRATHALKVGTIKKQYLGRPEERNVYLGFVTLESGSLSAVGQVKTKMTSEQAQEIVNCQEYGVSDVGTTVNKETVVVKSGWNYDSALDLLGYDREHFEKLLGITDWGFDDDTSSCHECGLFDSNDDCYTQNFRIVDECTLLGVKCGCYQTYMDDNPSEALTELNSPGDLFKAKNVCGTDVPDTFEEIDTLFCDSSGFGSPGEPALTKEGAESVAEKLIADAKGKQLYCAITDAGQFQVYVTIYQLEVA